jgi:hypothetical protein
MYERDAERRRNEVVLLAATVRKTFGVTTGGMVVGVVVTGDVVTGMVVTTGQPRSCPRLRCGWQGCT